MDDDFLWDGPPPKLEGVVVHVKRNNIDAAIRTLKRKMAQEGVLKDAQKHEYHIPNTTKRRRKEAEARRRWLKKKRMMEDFDLM